MMRVLSQWFPGTVKPVRDGPYLAVWHESDPPTLDVYEGGNWREIAGARIMGQPIRWRGLAFDPELIRQYSEVGNEDLFLVRCRDDH